MSPTRGVLAGGRGDRVGRAARAIVPRPKIAVGILTYLLLQALAGLGVDLAVVGLSAHSVEALVTFVVMWWWRDPFAVPLTELPLGVAHVPQEGSVQVTFADRTQATIVRDRLRGVGTTRTVDIEAAAAAIDGALTDQQPDA